MFAPSLPLIPHHLSDNYLNRHKSVPSVEDQTNSESEAEGGEKRSLVSMAVAGPGQRANNEAQRQDTTREQSSWFPGKVKPEDDLSKNLGQLVA